MLFFPYSFWNNNIERYDYDNRIYGDQGFGKDFSKLFLGVDKILKTHYAKNNIRYINPPQSCILDRNKIATASLLRKNGIPTPKIYNIKNLDQLEKILDKTELIYVKPVFGSMGKGISVVTKKSCYTNYIFRGNRITSRPYDYNWNFVKISKKRRNAFLSILIKKRFLFEEGIKLPVVKGRRFDMRVYVIYNHVPCLFARSVPESNFITNWSQGGRIEGENFIKKYIPTKKLEEIKNVAKKAARVTALNYAGIDIVLEGDSQNIYVLEVHSFPGYARKFNLMKTLINQIK